MAASDILTLITSVFTGFLAFIGWQQYRKTTELAKSSTISLKTFQLNELMTKKANDCNQFFPYGLQEDNDDSKVMHCYNEIIISINSLDHLLETSDKELRADKGNFIKLFWINLNTRIREAIEKRGYDSINSPKILGEYKDGHKRNVERIRAYLHECL